MIYLKGKSGRNGKRHRKIMVWDSSKPKLWAMCLCCLHQFDKDGNIIKKGDIKNVRDRVRARGMQ